MPSTASRNTVVSSPKPARKRVRKAPSARRPGSAAKPRRSKAEAAPQALLPAPDKKG